MIPVLMAAVLAATAPQALEAPQEQSREQVRSPGVQTQDAPTRLEDIEVTGRRLEAQIRDFVDNVAAPNAGRNLARWDRAVCVGVSNLRTGTAQYIADRVSTVAEDLGLHVGRPDCTPNILVIASSDPGALSATLIERSPRSFRPGGSGMDRGGAQLNAFRDSDRPVRWWAVSVPTDYTTGERAVRLPGECRGTCGGAIAYAPLIFMTSASRLSTQIIDNLERIIVVVDMNQVEGLSVQQLADYIAMVSLAQINTEADTSAYASILNLFEDPDQAQSLTEWDQAYLRGLYDAQRTQKIAGANRSEVIATIRRAHRDLRQGETD